VEKTIEKSIELAPHSFPLVVVLCVERQKSFACYKNELDLKLLSLRLKKMGEMRLPPLSLTHSLPLPFPFRLSLSLGESNAMLRKTQKLEESKAYLLA